MRLFFSHGSEDDFLVEKLRPDLEQAGAQVFVDHGMEFGDNFRNIIIPELNQSDEVLVLLTPTSIERAWVMAEIGATVFQGKRIVCFRYGPRIQHLHERGIVSLLGHINLPHIREFDRYLQSLVVRLNGGGN